MRIRDLYFPPEWAPQKAVWVGWPHLRGEWGDAFDGARFEIAEFVRALSLVTPVRMACGSREAYTSAFFAFEHEIGNNLVSLHTLPTGDIWLRDTGPIFGFQAAQFVAHQFQFNGWGGKYLMAGDTMTAGGIASVERAVGLKNDFVLEGGAVEFDGTGNLLTTRQCVLNPNRNSHWTESVAETAILEAFAAQQVIWLENGLLNDHTDGHIDNIARFIGPGRVICQSASGADDPNADVFKHIETDLRAAGLEVVTLPSPGRIESPSGCIEPASHLNFLISNEHVFVPTYEDFYSARAIEVLESALPGYIVHGLPARNILAGGGAFHCMTQQVPAGMEEWE